MSDMAHLHQTMRSGTCVGHGTSASNNEKGNLYVGHGTSPSNNEKRKLCMIGNNICVEMTFQTAIRCHKSIIHTSHM